MQNSKWTLRNGILWMPKNKGSMFRYFVSTSQQWNKSLKSLRKAWKSKQKNKEKKETPEIFIERVKKDEKRITINDTNFQPQVSYFLFFWSLVPQIVQRCQRKCGINLKAPDNEDYLVVKSHGSTTFTRNGEEKREVVCSICAFQ